MSFQNMHKRIVHVPSFIMRYNVSNYDKPQLRYSCFSEHSLVSHSHLRSLSLRDGNLLRPPSVWLKLLAPMLKLPQNLMSFPLQNGFFHPSLFVGVIFTCPLLHFVATPSPYFDRSLNRLHEHALVITLRASLLVGVH